MAYASSKIGAQEAIIKPCDLCEDDENVNWFCKDCSQSLCDRCKRTHLRSNVSKTHTVLSISEGIIMGKKNISNICQDHNNPFLFFCRTCEKNICPTCLSSKHKRHDMVELRKLTFDVQKRLDGALKDKEKELQIMTKNYDALVQFENDSDTFLKERYYNIEDKVKIIKLTTDEEGEKMKRFLRESMERHEKEAKEGQRKVLAQTNVYKRQIQSVKDDLRIQTASSLNNFLKESLSKLESLRPMSFAVPNMDQLFSEGKVDRNQIRQMIGKNETNTWKISAASKSKENTKPKHSLLSELAVINSMKISDGICLCFCLSPDDSIWFVSENIVTHTSHDCSTILSQIPARKDISRIFGLATYMACLQSGDAIVAYSGPSSSDKFTSDGRREESFLDLSPRAIRGLHVNTNDQIIVNADEKSLVIFSREGQQLKEISVNRGIYNFCTDKDGNFIIAQKNVSNFIVLNCNSSEIMRTWPCSSPYFFRLTCDRFGNILGLMNEDIYLFSKDGDLKLKETYSKDNTCYVSKNGAKLLSTMHVASINSESNMGMVIGHFVTDVKDDGCGCTECEECPVCSDCGTEIFNALVDYCTLSGASVEKCRECLQGDFLDCNRGVIDGCTFRFEAGITSFTEPFAFAFCFPE